MLDLDPAPLEAAARDAAARHHCPSVAWAVGVEGRVVASGSTGALDDGARPSTATVYRIASMTKSFTAAAVLALRDDGVLRLDDPITAHAPELAAVRGPTRDAAPITLGHLLSMASGLATDDVWADRHLDISDGELDTLVARGGHFAVPTGTTFEYSNLGFALIGRIVLRATGRRVQDHVRERFVEPLGLTRTAWVQPEHDDWARPYRWLDGAHAPERLVGDGALAPMGGIWSCLDDLLVWSDWFDSAYPARDDPDTGPLGRASRREMQAMRNHAGSRTMRGRSAPQAYGYGLLVRDDPVLGRLPGHSGGLPGYGSNMRWTRGRRVAVVALANVTYAPMAELTLELFDALHDAGALPPIAVPVSPGLEAIARRLVDLLLDWDDERAAALFTDNVAWDEPFARRRDAFAALVGDSGPLEVASITALSAAAADVVLTGRDGASFTVELELAPLLPLRVQSYSVQRTPPSGTAS